MLSPLCRKVRHTCVKGRGFQWKSEDLALLCCLLLLSHNFPNDDPSRVSVRMHRKSDPQLQVDTFEPQLLHFLCRGRFHQALLRPIFNFRPTSLPVPCANSPRSVVDQTSHVRNQLSRVPYGMLRQAWRCALLPERGGLGPVLCCNWQGQLVRVVQCETRGEYGFVRMPPYTNRVQVKFYDVSIEHRESPKENNAENNRQKCLLGLQHAYHKNDDDRRLNETTTTSRVRSTVT